MLNGVLEVTTDTIKVQQGGIKTQTFILSRWLQTNTSPDFPGHYSGNGITEVRAAKSLSMATIEKAIGFAKRSVSMIRMIQGSSPKIGTDTVTIRNDKGKDDQVQGRGKI